MSASESVPVTAPSLVEFLHARIAEDEYRAKAARGWQTGSRHEGQPLDWSIHMDRWSPDRVLAECEAKRRIVEKAQRADAAFSRSIQPASSAASFALTEVLQFLALPYADHPDYRQEWRP